MDAFTAYELFVKQITTAMTASELYELLDGIQDQLNDGKVKNLNQNESDALASLIENALKFLDDLD
jgi:hypothetical protein